MSRRTSHLVVFAAALLLALVPVAQATAQVVSITQTKALNGTIIAGDAAGFPITIAASGSYRLDSNLSVGTKTDAIRVQVENVTIDLNGFSITNAFNARIGIVAYKGSITIKNGTISGFREDGIAIVGGFNIIQDMKIFSNRTNGVRNERPNGQETFSSIERSIIYGNSQSGVFCEDGCNVQHSAILINGNGIVISNRGNISNNTISGNIAYGVDGNSRVGVGDNAISDNSEGATRGGVKFMSPNACTPVAC